MKTSDFSLRSVAAVALAVVILGRSGPAQAAGFYWSLGYEPAVPVGSVRNFAADVAPLGFGADIRYWFRNNFSIGVGATFHRLHESLEGTFPLERGAITATIHRDVEIFSVTPQAHVYLGSASSAKVIPYAGVGAGVSTAIFQVRISDLEVNHTSTGFAVSTEAGILFPVDRNDGILFQALMIGARYSFSTVGNGDVKDIAFVSLRLGALVY